ncbi:hypothetical protein CBG49_00270 [Capnocytophaga endodontalis]|uniref:Uncharacterized protein n=1 Tax=Capnocytophaga endodontalis TaxID=2708117 RepID=A0A1Z4BK61_9FLAO|nr:hypothetical protein CBG49_00270 [Capnocytophaga endodontalis]
MFLYVIEQPPFPRRGTIRFKERMSISAYADSFFAHESHEFTRISAYADEIGGFAVRWNDFLE